MPRLLNRYGIQVGPLCVFFGNKLTTTTLLRTVAFACVLSILGGVSWIRSARAATIEVAAGGDLQAAIYNAAPGDTIILQAGASYTGNFILPNKSGDAFITIRTSTTDSELPGGVRVTPADSGKMAKIVTPGNGMPAIRTETAAHHYRLIGLEIMPATPQSVVYEVVALGSAGVEQNTLDKVPHYITIDRCFIHGHPNANFKRGIGLNSAHTEILNSHISDFHSDYQDSQAIGGFNGPGSFKIINNRLEGAAENIMFGGATPAIYGLVPSNVEIRRNHFYKPRAWKPGEPGSTSYRPWIKNLFEIKNGQDFIIDGNIMENNWYQADQHGTAIVLSPRSEGGAAPWVVVQRITFTNNRIVNVGGGVGILGKDDGAPNDIATNNVTFRNNLFENIRNDYSIDGSRVIQTAGGSQITFDHNTILHANNFIRGRGAQTSEFAYTNNITHYGYGLSAECGNNQAALNCHFPGHTFLNNAIIRSPYGAFGASNFYPADETAVGFTNYAGSDYRLAANSPYKFAGTDGKDLGADIDSIEAAYRGGATATPTPTPTPTPAPSPTPSDGWTFCADENQRCAFTDTRQVRYGQNGTYSTGTFTNGVDCTNAVFGDPLPGVVKRCEFGNIVQPSPSPSPTPTPTPSPTPTPAPAAPSNLAAQAVSSSQINLTWIDNSDGETEFKVERSNDGVNFAQIGSAAANVRSYSDLGVRANKTYFYRVRAYNAAGHSGYTNTASAKTLRR